MGPISSLYAHASINVRQNNPRVGPPERQFVSTLKYIVFLELALMRIGRVVTQLRPPRFWNWRFFSFSFFFPSAPTQRGGARPVDPPKH